MTQYPFLASVLLIAVAAAVLGRPESPLAEAGKTIVTADEKPKKVLRHVVLFKFKKTATKKQIRKVVTEFAALPKKIDTIIGFEMGTDVSVEDKTKGFTHGFVVTFRNKKGRAVYLPHPAHKAFVKIVGPVIDDVLVFDYWTAK